MLSLFDNRCAAPPPPPHCCTLRAAPLRRSLAICLSCAHASHARLDAAQGVHVLGCRGTARQQLQPALARAVILVPARRRARLWPRAHAAVGR
eukprot:1724381-Prymnesium_polylepis.1